MTRLIPMAFCSLLFSATLCAQGPIDGYLKGKGNLDIAVSLSNNSAQDFFGKDGAVYNEPFRGRFLALFAEYGFTDDLDIVATLPYVFTSTQSGFQDGSLHLKFRPLRIKTGDGGFFNAVAAAGISAPLSNYEPLAAGAIGQRATVLQPRLVLQWDSGFGPFFNLTGGYNVRLDALREEDIAGVRLLRPDYNPEQPKNFTNWLIKAGLPAANYYLDVWLERQFTQGGADYAPMVPDLPQAYGVTYTQIGGTAYYSENGKVGFYLSGAHILSGRNTSGITRITAGVVLKLSTQSTN
ncbi:MAG TPA: hypothetical protein PK198_24825 [Saprospiraceae bacterium]|jgi:hypothetical protein|nr:hypothetical protein [Saprospiraceae bacterium]HRF42050.1 hypothetical protein [Saprospiraceae bacterium]HRJ14417.1 hypothetical protein [Saprospiraceae bacterium]HRK83702.1 hypothetical protein [Saprospiraceae bacterium]